MPTLRSQSKPTPPPGHIHLILSSDDQFYLEIPLNVILLLCNSPRKYLQYLGWCTLGVEGTLVDAQGNGIPLDGGPLDDQAIYQYNVIGDCLAHAVDLEVIHQRSEISSETTPRREVFVANILRRDGNCMFSGMPGDAMHIIPHRRGDEWLQIIIADRMSGVTYNENLDGIGIDDIRNGFCGSPAIHVSFDTRNTVILKTPNPILQTTDIPARHVRDLEPHLSFPGSERYTMHWLVTPIRSLLNVFPNNNDGTFLNQRMRKPSDLILHYNYGAAAVKQWGRGSKILANRPGVPRPPVAAPASMGPSKTGHNHKASIRKRDHAMSQQEGTSRKGTTRQSVQDADSEEKASWDEDDVMLYLRRNTKVAREWFAREEQERNKRMEEWRAGVAMARHTTCC